MDRESLYIAVAEQQILCRIRNNVSGLPPFLFAANELGNVRGSPKYLLGFYNNNPCYVLGYDEGLESVSSELELSALRSLLGQVDDEHFDLAGRACQIINWDREHRFCGSCGSRTECSDTDHARFCDRCNRHYYPRISPCIIVVVTRGEHCLLAKNAAWERDYYSALAGFVEAGETVEHCLVREVREEVSIEVENLTYFGSQPWPFPGQLMLGFHAHYKSGDIQVDRREIAEAHWWHYKKLPPCPGPQTLSGRLIDHFVQQCEKGIG